MSYPTIQALRLYEATARKDADEYRLAGNIIKANQREDDADWYDLLARREEWRLENLNPKKEAA